MTKQRNNFKIVIIGGGSAGWLTALFVKSIFKNSFITLIESENIPTIGVGEATTPQIITFLEELDIDFIDVLKNTDGTIKNGISFENWNGDGKKYLHGFSPKGATNPFTSYDVYLKYLIQNKLSFLDSTYTSLISYENKINLQNQSIALHFDACKFSNYLLKLSKDRGIEHIIDDYETCEQDKNGFIRKIKTTNHLLDVDFVFDCSGFEKLFLGNLFKDKWIDYQKHLPMKKAVLFPTKDTNLKPYTTAKAMKYGWVFEIPLQNRMGRGYIFDSDYINTDQSVEELKTVYDNVKPLRTIDFNAGRFTNSWIKNCIGLGLSSNFVEPLESTSIFVTIGQLNLLKKFKKYIVNYDVDEIKNYNETIGNNNDAILKFIYLHYLTKRKDSDFWLEFKDKNIAPAGMDLILNDIENGQLDKHSLPRLTSSAFSLESYLHICNGLEIYKEPNMNLPIFPNHLLYSKIIELELVKNNEQLHTQFISNVL
tara:strand:+ start:54 stop:1499 length:1446 start_codon:yes stop_codon:yes gene_type:complete